MVHISYFASCMTENDCSLLVFISQKVSQTANVPVATNTTHSSKFNRSCSSWGSRPRRVQSKGKKVHPVHCSTRHSTRSTRPPRPCAHAAGATGRHACVELHFYTTRLHSACTRFEASTLSSFLSCSCSSSPPTSTSTPLQWEKGALSPQGPEGRQGEERRERWICPCSPCKLNTEML